MLKSSIYIIATALVCVLLFALGLSFQNEDFTVGYLLEAIFHYDESNSFHVILLNLRMPRMILALLVGAALSFSGYLLQSLVNNPLADPYILGTASGASLGANFAFMGILPVSAFGLYLPPIYAFVGGVAITLIVVAMAYKNGRMNLFILILGGVAMVSFVASLLSLLIYTSDTSDKIRTVLFWAMGSFEKAQWSHLPMFSAITFVIVTIGSFMHKQITLLILGETQAKNLGLNISRTRVFVIAASCILTGYAVSLAGPVGFIGLIVPHFVRARFGINGPLNLFFSAYFGGVFMLACDVISRVLYPPVGLPIGVVTSILGIPFFVYLLFKSNYRFNQ